MAQILLQAAALINKDDTKKKPTRKRVRKALAATLNSEPAQSKRSRQKRKRVTKSTATKESGGRAVELGAWLKSL